MTQEHSLSETAFAEYEHLLVQLAEAMRHRREDDARAIRAQMEPLERHLNDAQMERLDDLSAELYQLEGKEYSQRTDPALAAPSGLGADLKQAWERQDWNRVLILLRHHLPFVADDRRAYLRAVAYEHLGMTRASQAFFSYAAQLRPEDITYRSRMLDVMIANGDLQTAERHARQSLQDSQASPALKIRAAAALVQTVSALPPDHQHERFEEVKQFLLAILAQSDYQPEMPQEALALAYQTLAFCLRELGEMGAAVEASEYAMGVAGFPSLHLFGRPAGLTAVIPPPGQVSPISLKTQKERELWDWASDLAKAA